MGHASAAERTERYALFLSRPAAARNYSAQALRGPEAQTYRESIRAEQATIERQLAAKNFRITGDAQLVLNAVFVEAPPSRVAELAAMPGVRGVARLKRFHRTLNKAAILVNATAAWTALGGTGSAGVGRKIAIIDSGIDQTHPAFQDSSLALPSGYSCVNGQQSGRHGTQDCSFTNNKVIYARSYVAELASGALSGGFTQSRPDDVSPRDHSGHGTGLAMIAAGETVAGPLATITGIAPKAWLGSYKVFGSPGVNDFTGGDVLISAIEDAVADGMDVAVLSLGSPAFTGPLDTGSACGNSSGVPCDPEAQAVENAVQAGMLVVCSAGNDQQSGVQLFNPTLGTIESPGTAPSAISVGASTNSHIFLNRVVVPGSGVPTEIQSIPASFGTGPLPSPPQLTAPLVDVTSLDSTDQACGALPANSLHNDIALIVRGGCTFDTKAAMVADAGAIGVIVIQNNNSEDLSFAPDDPNATIPLAMIGASEGNALKTYLSAHAGLQVTLDASTLTVVDGSPSDSVPPNQLAFFSSVGPSINYLAKPELVAVGTNVYMATQKFDSNSPMWDPSGFTAASGTSFGAPMVAGAVALVKQQHTNFTPAQLKSAVVGTASQVVTENDSLVTANGQAHNLAVGNGLLNVGNAIATQVTTTPTTLSFGAIGVSSHLPVALNLTVHYSGPAGVVLTLAVSGDSPLPTLSTPALSFQPGGADQTVTLTLSGTTPAPNIYQGALTITGAGPDVRVPYIFLVTDGNPANIVPLAGSFFEGPAGQSLAGGLAFKVTDQFGVGLSGVPVSFTVASGGGSIQNSDSTTDANGIAVADVTLGDPGNQEFDATAGGVNGISIAFSGTADATPTIWPNGAVNAASYHAAPGIVPGSYLALFGDAFSTTMAGALALPLPLAITDTFTGIGTSVSFEVPSSTQGQPPTVSLPGNVLYVSPGQVNVQVPWELAGQSSVQIRVNFGATTGAIYTATVVNNAPGTYMNADLSAIATDANFNLITSANRAVPGQAVTVYANALGAVNPIPTDGEAVPQTPATPTTQPVTATIAGTAATVQFSGLAPFYPSLGEVQLVVPAGAPSGLQPVVLTINGVSSPPVNIFVQ